MRNSKTNELVLTGLFTAIIIIMAFTPLGYIPLVVINATIIHIPVILGSLFCGPKKGAFLGFVFGFTSCLKATIVGGTLSSFVFSPVLAASLVGTSGIFKSLFIAFVPRILVGVIPYFVYIGIKKVLASEKKNLWGTVLNVLMSVFLAFGVGLEFTDDAVNAIADKALERKTGARGLRAIMEAVMLDLMYRIPSDKSISRCVIDKDIVEENLKLDGDCVPEAYIEEKAAS